MKTFLPIVLAACAACSGGNQDAGVPTSDADAGGERTARPTLAVDAEVGAMNEAQVSATFQRASDALLACFSKGTERIAFLSGGVHVYVRVDASGKPIQTYMKKSTLGDRETESCMIGVLKNKSWPAPVGGREGIAETDFSFDPQPGRQPVAWSESDAGKNVAKAKAAIAECSQGARAGKLNVTLYVETDGSVLSAGVAGEEPGTEQAASCVVSKLKDIKLNSPGSFAAKLSLD